MKSLLTAILLLVLLLGCGVHIRTYYTIYTPAKPLTNNFELMRGTGVASNPVSGIYADTHNQMRRPVQ